MQVTCPQLSALQDIRHGFFTRRGGVSTGIYASLNCGYGSGDAVENVSDNRAILAEALGQKPEALCTAYQIHSPTAVVLERPWKWQDAPQADALVTATPGIIVGVMTADCLPVLLADPLNRVVAAAHAGWKGAFGGVLEAALSAMTGLGAQKSSIVAAIGPAIAQGSYEVGADFHDRFLAQDSGNALYFIHGQRPNHFLFDLKAYAKDRLKSAGIAAINVLADDTCLQEDDFFSYRRACLRGEQAYGRQVSAIVLEK